MKKYKDFREQSLECDKNGTRMEVPSTSCRGVTLICKKYNCYCNSGACREERRKFDKNGFYTTNYLENKK